ncbi:japanin-like-RA1 isoform X3 [Rhipicephalus microplus]|uniref:japanin-like-RA1 isoform X3 n=1 Tax=Rhipicephalus microplus TaxID=6941 RepID=UPI003F6CF25A
MRLYLFHALFACIFMFAICDFIRTSLDSDLCAFETDAGIICVNRTLNSTVCPVASNGSRLPCVNITSNSSCRKELGMEATQSPEMKLEYTPIDNTKPPDYPLPASQNMLYLVGYSENLSMSEYPCVASTYMYYMWGAHYRELLLKTKKSGGPWDRKGILRIEATLCSMRMNLSWACLPPKLNGLQKQYLMLFYTWDTMVLSDLIQEVGVKPNCSLWAKKNYKTDVEVTTKAYFMSICDNPKVISYPGACPSE